MKIELFDTKEVIKINKLEEVTSPVLFDRGGVPNPDGLVSNRIFGVSVRDRKEKFAYIDLNGYFFNPHIYKVFKRLYRNIENIINGTESYSITSKGELVKDPNGETGIQFIYDNWEKIKWERTEGMRNERIDILTKTPKNQIFTRYQIVIPAFYRDISSSSGGGGSTSELNTFYVALIRLASLIKDETLFDFSFHSTNLAIQNKMVEIYDYFKSKLTKKSGLIRKFLLGKNTDYGVRSVIAAPTFHCDDIDDEMIDLTHCAVPISQACVMFYPFVFAWVRNYLDSEIIERQFNKSSIEVPGEDPENAVPAVKFDKPEAVFDDKYIMKMINRYIKNPDGRYETINIPLSNGKTGKLVFVCRPITNGGIPGAIYTRYMTITDILYMACVDVTANKHVIITRYPVLNLFGATLSRVRISSTIETMPVDVNGQVYKWYPKIDLNTPTNRVGVQFVDTTKFSNSLLHGMNGDYDGDQVTVKGVFTVEANEEAEKIIESKSYVLTIGGENIRTTDCECVQTLYVLTKHPTDATVK